MLSGCCVHRQQPVKTLRLSSGDSDLLSLVIYFSLSQCLCECVERKREREIVNVLTLAYFSLSQCLCVCVEREREIVNVLTRCGSCCLDVASIVSSLSRRCVFRQVTPTCCL